MPSAPASDAAGPGLSPDTPALSPAETPADAWCRSECAEEIQCCQFAEEEYFRLTLAAARDRNLPLDAAKAVSRLVGQPWNGDREAFARKRRALSLLLEKREKRAQAWEDAAGPEQDIRPVSPAQEDSPEWLHVAVSEEGPEAVAHRHSQELWRGGMAERDAPAGSSGPAGKNAWHGRRRMLLLALLCLGGVLFAGRSCFFARYQTPPAEQGEPAGPRVLPSVEEQPVPETGNPGVPSSETASEHQPETAPEPFLPLPGPGGGIPGASTE